MKYIFLFLSFALLPQICFSQYHQPILPDSSRWLRDMTREVSEVNHAQDCIQHWTTELGNICHDTPAQYTEARAQAISLCRSIVRLGIRENTGRPTPSYLQLLKQLSNYFQQANDTLLTLAIELEYNRLFYQENLTYERVGRIDSEKTDSLYTLFRPNDLEVRIRLLWMAKYLFGRHGLATRLEAELGIDYMMDEHNFTAGYLYWRRAENDKNSRINDANTNSSYVMLRDSVVYPTMEQIRSHDPAYAQQIQYRELIFHSDQSLHAQKARKEILPMVRISNHSDIMRALLHRELGIDYLNHSDLNYAIHYFNNSISDYKQNAQTRNDTLIWCNTLYLLGMAQERIGNGREAKKAYEEVVSLLLKSPSIQFSSYFSQVALARVCIALGERYSTRKTINGLEAILKGPDDIDFNFDFLPDIGTDYKNKEQVWGMLYISYFYVRALELESNDIDEAVNYAYFAHQFFEQRDMTDNYFYHQNKVLLARLLIKRGGDSVRVGSPTDLLRSCIQAYHNGKKIELPDVVAAYNLLAEIATKASKEKEASNNYHKAFEEIANYALDHLFTMTEGNRARFWEKVKPAITQTLEGCLAHVEAMPSLASTALDCSIFMKGLLLQSSNEVRHLVYDTGDSQLIRKYEDLLRQQESAQSSEYLSSNPEELSILHHPKLSGSIAQLKERFLFNSSQLTKLLKKGEIAIEMVETKREFDDRSIITTDHQYGAIVVSANKDLRYIPLFRGKDMERITLLTDPRLYKQIWQPLESIISDCRTIYFSASGLLHSLPIENAITNDGKAISERFSIHRLSSLRQLSLSTKKAKEKAAIFGGLTYQLSQQDWQAQSAGNDDGLVFRDLPDLESLRGARVSLKELPGTLEEATYLDDLLHKKHIPTTFQQKSHGTEGTFKKLSGQGVTLLHIGTHGYASSVEDGVTDENVLLSRCGLLLAGAGNTLSRSGFPNNPSEDGILTAREICSMDLRGLDMAVLSACKTGLGEISSDGVFGLQRGFKKAGAKTLVMSLRNVDDQITTRFIRFFYENIYQKGMTKHDAFVSAQKQLRHELPEHSDEWTTFIMIDD